jgi:hypothetical protein
MLRHGYRWADRLPVEVTGAPQPLGRLPTFGDWKTVAPAGQYAVVFVGHNRGSQKRHGHCSAAPATYGRKKVDNVVLAIRTDQIGEQSGATAYPTVGYWEGKPEHSTAYQFLYVTHSEYPPAEKTYREFKANMNELAERVARDLCQDAVYVLHWDGRGSTIVEAK